MVSEYIRLSKGHCLEMLEFGGLFNLKFVTLNQTKHAHKRHHL